jgi:hypothetical protein
MEKASINAPKTYLSMSSLYSLEAIDIIIHEILIKNKVLTTSHTIWGNFKNMVTNKCTTTLPLASK